MKRFALSLFLLAAVPAYAADPAPKEAPKPPSCGATAADCQKIVEALQKQLAQASIMVQALQRQRNNAATTNLDTELSAYMQQQQTAQGSQAH